MATWSKCVPREIRKFVVSATARIHLYDFGAASRSSDWSVIDDCEMTQLILISVVGLLIGNTLADVLVQPGYGQPSPSLLSHPLIQPLSTLPQFASPGLLQPRNPGYYLELHPVHGNLGHPTGGLGFLQGHDLSALSRPDYRRLNVGRLGGLGHPGKHGFIPPHIPVPGLRRFRRSTGELRDPGVQREKRSEPAVATKSTLNGDSPMVVDLLNQDTEEKHVEVRHSKNAHTRSSSTILGLNPASMYPVQNQYRFVSMPTYGPYQQVVNEHPEIANQMNARTAIQEQATPQDRATTSAQNTTPRINPADLQHAMLLQQTYQQSGTSQTAVDDQQRNYPDPRPVTTTQSSTKAQKNDRNKLKNTAVSTTFFSFNAYLEGSTFTSRESKIAVPTDDQEIVGSSAKHHNIKIHAHIHRGKFAPRNNVINEAYTTCPCSNPSYVVYNENDETANNLAYTQLGPQQPTQVFQLAPVQENYLPNSGYVVLPQTYSNPIVNCDREYPSSLTGTYYTMPDGTTLPVEYQLG
ncbi:uncharacterized protein LOC143212402 [Lasioglossum baleicum]|uniref:uncharacterized protein LOC143212402 n=1 Tax=Lasioglossum baleicum TaxID=434251 RepID=UPI003FCE866E